MRITIIDAIIIAELKKLDITVFENTFYSHPYGFQFHSFGAAFDTSEPFELEGIKFNIIERDVTSDEEREDGSSYSEYQFKVITPSIGDVDYNY